MAICYQPNYAKLSGSAAGGIILSQADYWNGKTSRPNRWFYKSKTQWAEETGLNPYQVDSAIDALTEKGVLEKKKYNELLEAGEIQPSYYGGVSNTWWYRVDHGRIDELLAESAGTREKSSFGHYDQSASDTAIKAITKITQEDYETATAPGGKLEENVVVVSLSEDKENEVAVSDIEDETDHILDTNSEISADMLIAEGRKNALEPSKTACPPSSSSPRQTEKTGAQGDSAPNTEGNGNKPDPSPLNIPKCLNPKAAINALKKMGDTDPAERQAVLDTVAQAHADGRVKTTPIQYLHGVIGSWDSGAWSDEQAEKGRKEAHRRANAERVARANAEAERRSVERLHAEQAKIQAKLNGAKQSDVAQPQKKEETKQKKSGFAELKAKLGGAFNRKP